MKKSFFGTVVVILIAFALFVSCSQEQIVSENLVENGDFENGNRTDVYANGCWSYIASGKGINGSKALDVTPAEAWGRIEIPITSYYGQGKSYYVESSFRNNGSTGSDPTVRISYIVVSEAVASHFKNPLFDCTDIYGGQLLSNDEAKIIFGIDTNPSAVLGNEYVTVSAVIPATEIDKILTETTQKYGSGDPSLVRFYVCFSVGGETDHTDYSYYVDNVVIKDLNSELPKQ